MSAIDHSALPPLAADVSERGARRAAPRRRNEMAMFAIGSLQDDAGKLAAAVSRASACSTITVWVDDEFRVHCACVDVLPSVPLHWIVGTYACGAEPSDIADDLRHERSERERVWLLD